MLGTAVVTESKWLFPAALGVLVASKAYGVTRAAAVPRLLPERLTLVKANARVSLSGVVGATVSAPIAGLASMAGPEWSLRYAFVLFVIATVCAIRLPDEGRLEQRRGHAGACAARPRAAPGRKRMRIPGAVAFALRANCGPRWLSGFLTMFMAFLLREHPIGDWEPSVLLGRRDRHRRARQHPRHRPASMLEDVNPEAHRRAGAARRRRVATSSLRCSTACLAGAARH